MRFLSYLTFLLVVALVSACGGGGGSSGSNPQLPTVITTAPSNLFMPIGVVQQYVVKGGVAPYTVSSNNTRIVTASLRGDILLLNSVGQGSASITIRDRNTGVATISVSVGDPLALSLTNVRSFVGDVVKVLITGGTPPYRTSVLDTAVAAEVNGSELLLTLRAVSKVDVVVIDALNQQVKMNVEVITGSPQFNLVPAAMTISENSTLPLTFTVLGGVGPMTVRSSDTNLLQASISGNVVTVTTGTNTRRCVPDGGAVVNLEVVDSRGAFATSQISIIDNPDGCGLRVSSNPVTVIVGDKVKTTLLGQSEKGTITVRSSDPQWATASYSDGVITVTGVSTLVTTVSGTATITTEEDSVRAEITVIDSGPPADSVKFDAIVLKKTP